jgi:predicted transcriptional regulator
VLFGVKSSARNKSEGTAMSNTVTLPESVFKRLEKFSASSKISPESIVKQAVQDRLDYEEWKVKKIKEGLADIKAGRVVSNEEFWVRMDGKMKAASGRKKAA